MPGNAVMGFVFCIIIAISTIRTALSGGQFWCTGQHIFMYLFGRQMPLDPYRYGSARGIDLESLDLFAEFGGAAFAGLRLAFAHLCFN